MRQYKGKKGRRATGRLNAVALLVLSAAVIGIGLGAAGVCRKAQSRAPGAYSPEDARMSAIDRQIRAAIREQEAVAVRMKDGRRFVARITGETNAAVYLRGAEKGTEYQVERHGIAGIKSPATGESVAFRLARIKERFVSCVNAVGRTKDTFDSWIRYHKEVALARRAKETLSAKLAQDALDEAKRTGNVVAGMTQADVVGVLGYPDSIEPAGNGRDEKWLYKKAGTVMFRNGKVAGE